jgi:glutamyl-tRNA synthetase
MARHYGGSFIIRIEDTDVARRVDGAVSTIVDSLRWLGLDWDEGPEVGGKYQPYFQSQRLKLYQETAQQLVKDGYAYPCYCSPERLEAMRAEQRQRKQPPGYDRHCRELSEGEKAKFEAQGITPVIRFKTPLAGQTSFTDLIRGEITFQNNTFDDFVLLKSDSYPTYHLANVVDDHLMEITHVLRADEWVASTPRHILLYQALGYSPPQFAHLPMILGPDRAKLSKRHGAVSIKEYQEQGYLSEAMVNFLALLGWALDDKTELFTREELIKYFSLERVGKTPAIFNLEKFNWMNGVYLRKLSQQEFIRRSQPFLERDLPPQIKRPLDSEYLAQIMPLVQERAKTLKEVAGLVDFFFVSELNYPVELLPQKMERGMAIRALDIVLSRLQQMEKFDAASLEALLRPLAAELGMKTRDFFGLLRIAVTGRTAAPPLFQTMAVLGERRCQQRIETALFILTKGSYGQAAFNYSTNR